MWRTTQPQPRQRTASSDGGTPRRDADLAARTRVPLPGALLGVAVHQLYHSRNVAAIVL